MIRKIKELYIKNDGNLFPLIMLQYLTDKATCHPLDDILVSLLFHLPELALLTTSL